MSTRWSSCRRAGRPPREELIAYCKEELAGFKVPKSLEIVDSLPKNASGKIDKLELKRRYEGEGGSV